MVVDTDGGLRLEVTERQEGNSDRRLAWWSVLLAMLLSLLACATAVLFAVILIRDRQISNERVDNLEQTIAEQDSALNCRAQLTAETQSTQAVAAAMSVELLIDVAIQFDKVLNDQPPDPFILQQQIQQTRAALDRARVQNIVHEQRIGQCRAAPPEED